MEQAGSMLRWLQRGSTAGGNLISLDSCRPALSLAQKRQTACCESLDQGPLRTTGDHRGPLGEVHWDAAGPLGELGREVLPLRAAS